MAGVSLADPASAPAGALLYVGNLALARRARALPKTAGLLKFSAHFGDLLV